MNDDQRVYWNGQAGESWALMQSRLTAIFAPVTAAIVAAAAPRAADRVLDIGCGSGDTTLAFAARVAAAQGIDISEPLLALARQRAANTGTAATFIAADAATQAADVPFDLLVSRFGVMFFDDPAAAFANLRRHAKPGGRLVFAGWQPPRANPWATVPMRALEHLLPPPEPADPHAPGPFALADAARAVALLTEAGWHDARAAPFDFTMTIGDGPDPQAQAVDFMMTIGPAARAVREAGPHLEAEARAALAAALAPYRHAAGVGLPAAVWLLTAAA